MPDIQTMIKMIINTALEKGRIKQVVDPRHVEGGLLLQYGRTGHLDVIEIWKEVQITEHLYSMGERSLAESNAVSFGL